MLELNLTEAQLADRLGTSQSAVSNALSGRTRFDLFRTEWYCDALEWSVEDFLHDYETTAPTPTKLSRRQPDDEDAERVHDDDVTCSEQDHRAAELGAILARLRKTAGPGGGKLQQQVLAEAVDRQQSFISKIEHANRKVDITTLEEMAWHLGSTLTAIYREWLRVAPRPVARGEDRNDPDDLSGSREQSCSL